MLGGRRRSHCRGEACGLENGTVVEEEEEEEGGVCFGGSSTSP